MNNNKYNFIGVINFFGICPDFVYPIFEKDNKYYFQRTEDMVINSFNEIKDNIRKKMIRFIDKNNIKCDNVKENYSIGDESLVAFQLNVNEFYVSDASCFVSFINDFITEDHILIENIDCFLDAVNRKNKKKKLEYKKI